MLTLLRCVIILGNPKFDFSIFFLEVSDVAAHRTLHPAFLYYGL